MSMHHALLAQQMANPAAGGGGYGEFIHYWPMINASGLVIPDMVGSADISLTTEEYTFPTVDDGTAIRPTGAYLDGSYDDWDVNMQGGTEAFTLLIGCALMGTNPVIFLSDKISETHGGCALSIYTVETPTSVRFRMSNSSFMDVDNVRPANENRMVIGMIRPEGGGSGVGAVASGVGSGTNTKVGKSFIPETNTFRMDRAYDNGFSWRTAYYWMGVIPRELSPAEVYAYYDTVRPYEP